MLIALITGVLRVSEAQTPILATDRPDFTESTASVSPGVIQLESGVTFESGISDIVSGPELLARIGVVRRIELRLGVPNYVSVDEAPSGFSDISVGAKFEAGDISSRLSTASVLTLILPSGEATFTEDAVVPEIIQTFSFEPGSAFSVGSQVRIGLPEDDGGDRALSYGATFVLGREMTSTAGSFLEVAVDVPVRGEPAGVLLHHGYTVRIHEGFQVDIHGGLGLTDEAPDYIVGGGVSLRLQ